MISPNLYRISVPNKIFLSINKLDCPSQFFICYTDCTFLDGSSAAFGKVTDGMEIIDSFLKVPRSLNEINEIAYPDNKIIIEKATMISPDKDNHPRVLMTMNDFLK
ncbi:MAG: peptidylprolyl isomerase [Oscillospiraceae bacterium]|nr:peptidylprolyl isomerase [Oscillospiraceae bacterium]